MSMLGTLQAVTFQLLVFVALINFGTTDSISRNLVAFGACLLAIAGTVIPLRHRALGLVHLAGCTVLGLLVATSLAQGWRGFDLVPPNPVWDELRRALGREIAGAVSVAPEQTTAAIVAFAPVLAFLTALRLFEDPMKARLALHRVIHASAVIAAFSLLQHVFWPDWVMFEKKQAYLGSLVGVFVNQNTAGAFFGLACITTLGLTFHYARGVDFRRLVELVFDGRDRLPHVYRSFLLYAALSLLQAVDLILTQSRGAALATAVAMALLVAVLPPAARRRSSTRSRIQRYLLWATGIVVAITMAEKITHRLTTASDEGRLCVYASTWRAIGENWPFGTGLATFGDAHPTYRDACTDFAGVWLQAHDTFLEGAMTLGLPFVAVMLVICVVFGGVYVTAIRRSRGNSPGAAIGFCTLALISIHSLVDFPIQIQGLAYYAAFVWALCTVLSLAGAFPHIAVRDLYHTRTGTEA